MEAHTIGPEDATALEMVRLGYAVDDSTDSRRVLTFRVRFNDREAAYEALRAIGLYNEFDGEGVARVLSECGMDRYISLEVGREGSPVVYAGPFFADARNENGYAPVVEAFRKVKADEVDFDGRMVRAWWA